MVIRGVNLLRVINDLITPLMSFTSTDGLIYESNHINGVNIPRE